MAKRSLREEYGEDDEDDQPSTKRKGPGGMLSMTYGELPDEDEFAEMFHSRVRGDYRYHLKGGDAETAEEVGFDPVGSVDSDGLYDLVSILVEAFNEGNEAAGDLASGILSTIGIEWI